MSSSPPDSCDLEDLLRAELDSSRSDDAGGNHQTVEIQTQTTGARPLKKIKTSAEQYCPPHPGYMGGICIRCGMEKARAELEEKRDRPGGGLSPRSEYFFRLKENGAPGASDRESPKNMTLNYIILL